jgi:hypothetical protein
VVSSAGLAAAPSGWAALAGFRGFLVGRLLEVVFQVGRVRQIKQSGSERSEDGRSAQSFAKRTTVRTKARLDEGENLIKRKVRCSH